MNSMIVSIGQATSIISPVFVGILLDYIGPKPICIAISGVSILSLFAGRYLLSGVYHSVPELANRAALPSAKNPMKRGTNLFNKIGFNLIREEKIVFVEPQIQIRVMFE